MFSRFKILILFLFISLQTQGAQHIHCKFLADKLFFLSGEGSDKVASSLLSFLVTQTEITNRNAADLEFRATAFVKQMKIYKLKSELELVTNELARVPVLDTQSRLHALKRIENLTKEIDLLEAQIAELIENIPSKIIPHPVDENILSDTRLPIVASFQADNLENPYQIGIDLNEGSYANWENISKDPYYEIILTGTYGSVYERLFEAERLARNFDESEKTPQSETFSTITQMKIESENHSISDLKAGLTYMVKITLSRIRDDFKFELQIFANRRTPE